MSPTAPPPGDNRPGPSGSVWSSRSFLAAVIVVVVLLIGGASVVLDHRGRGSGAATGQPAATAAGTPAAPLDTAIPTSAPPASWSDYHGVLIPSSPTAGPTRVVGDVASGFAHSPTGALLAAAQLPARRILAPDWTAVLQHSVVPGPGVTVWRSTRSQLGTQLTPPPGGWTQLAGYRFLSYSPDQAVIQFLHSAPSGGYTVTVTTVSWVATASGGDWKLVLQSDGDDTPNTAAVNSPAGFTIWQGST